jgi:hypothetical protein
MCQYDTHAATPEIIVMVEDRERARIAAQVPGQRGLGGKVAG